MKRLEPESIGDVLRQTLQEQGMTERLYETRAVSLWPSVIGEDIASMTGRPVVNNGLMTVYVRGVIASGTQHVPFEPRPTYQRGTRSRSYKRNQI